MSCSCCCDQFAARVPKTSPQRIFFFRSHMHTFFNKKTKLAETVSPVSTGRPWNTAAPKLRTPSLRFRTHKYTSMTYALRIRNAAQIACVTPDKETLVKVGKDACNDICLLSNAGMIVDRQGTIIAVGTDMSLDAAFPSTTYDETYDATGQVIFPLHSLHPGLANCPAGITLICSTPDTVYCSRLR